MRLDSLRQSSWEISIALNTGPMIGRCCLRPVETLRPLSGLEANTADMMETGAQLILKRSSLAHAGFDDYDVLCEGELVGRIYFIGDTSPMARAWFWGLASSDRKDRTPTHGYEPTREAAMAAFAKSWRHE